jgi:hypothetical protein
MEMLKTSAGIELQAVPYRGDAPLNAALIAGEIQVGWCRWRPRCRTCRTTCSRRSRSAARARGGVAQGGDGRRDHPRLRVSSWQGLFVPAGTPREIVMTIQRETAKALRRLT